MAFTATQISSSPKTYSIGPYKEEIYKVTCVSGDTSGTITAKSLHVIDFAIHAISGLTLTAEPTISGTTVTFAFTDPVGNRFGTVILRGK